MLNFLFLYFQMHFSLSSTVFDWKKVNSYLYTPLTLNKDGYFIYDKESKIEVEIIMPDNLDLEINKGFRLYQFKLKTDVKYNPVTDVYTGEYISYAFSKSEKITIKNAYSYFVLYSPLKNLNNLNSTIKTIYITFMPQINKNIKQNVITNLDISYSYINHYFNIDLSKLDVENSNIPSLLEISKKNDGDLKITINGKSCSKRKCNFDLSNLKSLEGTNYQLNIRNVNLNEKVSSQTIYFLLTEKPDQTISIATGSFISRNYINDFSKHFIYQGTYLKKYYALEEGAYVIKGSPKISYYISSLNSIKYEIKEWKSFTSYNLNIIYFLPKSSSQNDITIKNKDTINHGTKGTISIIPVPPTVELQFPSTFTYKEKKNENYPHLLRIIVNSDYNDDLFIKFPSNTECCEGKLFENNQFSKITKCSKINIKPFNSKINNIYTIIFKGDIEMKTEKNINYISINQYEMRSFSLKNELFFEFNKKTDNNLYIKFNNPSFQYKIQINIFEKEVNYDPNLKKYNNIKYRENLKYNLQFSALSKGRIIILIKCEGIANSLNATICSYNDIISIREGNIILQTNQPQIFKDFFEKTYIVFELILNDNKYYKLEINSNVDGYSKSMLENINNDNLKDNSEDNGSICNERKCSFPIQGPLKKYIEVKPNYINNDDDNKTVKTLTILLRLDKNEYKMSNSFNEKIYFISSFQYILNIEDKGILDKYSIAKEGGYVIKTEKGALKKYGISVKTNSNDQNIDINTFTYYYDNDEYNEFYFYNPSNYKISITLNSNFIFDDPSYFSFAYIPPTKIINFGEKIKIEESIKGIPIFIRLNKYQSNSKIVNDYIIGITEGYFTKGKIFDSNNKLNSFSKIKKQYSLVSDDYPYETYTFKFNQKVEIGFIPIDGEIKYYKERKYNSSLTLKFKKAESIYYIGLYDKNYNPAKANINKKDNKTEVQITQYLYNEKEIYNMNAGNTINKNEIFLNSQNDVYKFTSNGPTEITFSIFNEIIPTSSSFIVLIVIIIIVIVAIIVFGIIKYGKESQSDYLNVGSIGV